MLANSEATKVFTRQDKTKRTEGIRSPTDEQKGQDAFNVKREQQGKSK